MRSSFISVMLSLCASSAFADTSSLQIIIEVAPTRAEKGTATLDFAHKQEITLQRPRSFQRNAHTDLPQLKCDGIQPQIGSYGTTMSCSKLQWTVTFQSTRQTPRAIADQQNLYSPQGWWSLIEWSDIPRVRGISNMKVCGKLVGNEQDMTCSPLPEKSDPPLILTWGKAAKVLTTNATTLTLFKDDPTDALNEDHIPVLQRQIEYLQKVLNTEKIAPNKIDLIWVAINKELGQTAGAAGKQAFLANFAVTDGIATDDSIAKLHWVSAHELFHLLAPEPYPLWISESLAQYYGYKSLESAGLTSETPMEQWQNFKEHYPYAATGLYEAHNKVTRENNSSYYPLFYIKGAAFWQAVDQELQKAGTSLDKIVPQIEPAGLNHATLSPATIDLLKTTLSQKVVSTLQQQYLH
ncbi:hypothetical protein PsAD2_03323 [Pseudovibrio axinellae]|uniref:Peptidase MA-like domain-containing protein n=1 Tax=Pseudovibrio axinellae TaxID=989403 RepID=A0A165WMQ5_9HYPH|nr:hypothetical protein [Pseudovibrio axinellae]KZL16707.1 hypothetical protein PsAD2_03323 [Pseudovibrio axinellae]SEQ77966.1 hypothetical protein SAMN05421798_104186 [Pseudovibrio axinellae]